jgi:cytoskeleton protein RodZ
MVAQTESMDAGESADAALLTEPGAEVPEPPLPQPAAATSTVQGAVPDSNSSADSSSMATSPVREGPVGVLQFDFFEESWVEVTDRYGDVIYSDLNPAGVSLRLTGHPPLTVVIGNASGTVLTYNDKPIDLSPHTRVDVARVTVE